jgi:polysaccharide deacetylase family protein (PEP-CTERM system associated)
VACHGYGHELVYTLSREDFRRDVTSAKSLLEDILGQPVTGYRAPSYSITERSMWALDVLVEAGFTYDSSIFPIVHDNYGVPHAERFPHVIEREAGSLVEFPLTTLRTRLLGREFNLPIAGGGYLRLLPASLVARGIKRINRTERQPAVLYFHPWEVDPDQPRIKAGLKSSFRHYLNLDKTEDKLRHMLCAVPFGTMRAAIAEWSEARQACPAAEAAAEAT